MMHYQAKVLSKVFKIAMVLLLLSFCLPPPGHSQTRDKVDRLIQELGSFGAGVQWGAIEALVEMGRPAVKPLIAALKDRCSQRRRGAAVALGKIGDPRAVEPLIAIVERAWMLCAVEEAAVALGKIGDPRAIGPLIGMLKNRFFALEQEEVAEALGKMGEPAVKPLIALLEYRDESRFLGKGASVRKAAVIALGKIRSPHAVRALTIALRDEDRRVRGEARMSLGMMIKDYRIVEPLIDALGDEGPSVRRWAAIALVEITGQDFGADQEKWQEWWEEKGAAKPISARIGAPREIELGDDVPIVMESLFYDLLHSRCLRSRQAAPKKLREIGDPRAVEPLIAALRDETEKEIEIQCDAWRALATAGFKEARRQIVFALAEIGGPQALDGLKEATENHFCSATRRLARRAAESISWALNKEIESPDAIGLLVAALGDECWWVRRSAVHALGRAGKSAVKPLIAVLGISETRKRAIHALSKIAKPAVGPLVVALEDGNAGVRVAAAQALGRIGDSRGVEPLTRRLRDQDERVREAAAEALGNIGDPYGVEALIATLEDWEVRPQAARALGKIGDTRAVEPLIATLQRGMRGVSGRICSGTIWALGVFGDPRAVEVLIVASRRDRGRREAIITQALAKIGGPRAIEALIARLKCSRSHRRQAAEGLARIGDPRAVKPLIAVLGDDGIRDEAAWALEKIGEPAVEALIAALRGISWRVREKAAEVLGNIGDPRALDTLREMIENDPRSEIRKAARRAAKTIEERIKKGETLRRRWWGNY